MNTIATGHLPNTTPYLHCSRGEDSLHSNKVVKHLIWLLSISEIVSPNHFHMLPSSTSIQTELSLLRCKLCSTTQHSHRTFNDFLFQSINQQKTFITSCRSTLCITTALQEETVLMTIFPFYNQHSTSVTHDSCICPLTYYSRLAASHTVLAF